MASWINSNFEYILKQLGGLSTQGVIANGYIVDTVENITTGNTRTGAVLVCDSGVYNSGVSPRSVTAAGVYINAGGVAKPLYYETGLTDNIASETTLACVSTVTFTR